MIADPQPFRWAPFGPSLPDTEPAEAKPKPAPPTSTRPPARAPQTTAQGRIPARRVAIVTCMDPRIDPLAALGLALGDAHVIRNAGAIASDDVIRSLRLSRQVAQTETVILLAHSDCAAFGSDDEARAELTQGARRVAAAVAPDGDVEVVARFYDVQTGRVAPI